MGNVAGRSCSDGLANDMRRKKTRRRTVSVSALAPQKKGAEDRLASKACRLGAV
jgi:hypothetical protein